MDKLEALVNSLEKQPTMEKDDKIVKKLQEIFKNFSSVIIMSNSEHLKLNPILVEMLLL